MLLWVILHNGVPPAGLFSSTQGLGTPIVVDTATDTPYYLKNGVVTAFAGGGGGGAVSSVFGRSGAVVAASGDYTFAQIGSKPTTLAGYGITDAAPAAQGVTNGNSHDHSGGDGGPIAYASLSGLPTLFTAAEARRRVVLGM